MRVFLLAALFVAGIVRTSASPQVCNPITDRAQCKSNAACDFVPPLDKCIGLEEPFCELLPKKNKCLNRKNPRRCNWSFEEKTCSEPDDQSSMSLLEWRQWATTTLNDFMGKLQNLLAQNLDNRVTGNEEAIEDLASSQALTELTEKVGELAGVPEDVTKLQEDVTENADIAERNEQKLGAHDNELKRLDKLSQKNANALYDHIYGNPTYRPTVDPTAKPSSVPSPAPSYQPSNEPTEPTHPPTPRPTVTEEPTVSPTCGPDKCCAYDETYHAVYDGHVYRTLTKLQRDNRSTTACESTYASLPAGWEVSPRENGIIQKVISPYRWNTDCLVFADGSSFARGGGGSCSTNQLLRSGYNHYKVSGCYRVVLIRRRCD